MKLKKKINKVAKEEAVVKEPITNLFSHYKEVDQFLNAHIKGIEPMTAKELEEEKQLDYFNSQDNYIEEKFDGTRGMLHLLSCDPHKSLMFERKPDRYKFLVYELIRGTGFCNGRHRVYEHFIKNPNEDLKSSAKFLSEEFGTGGHSPISTPFSRGIKIGNNHSSSGLGIYTKDVFECDYSYTWSEVAKTIKDLIEEGIYYPQDTYTRCFSRRISKQTGWYCENTDSLPHLRDLKFPIEFAGTILDGEMFIPDRPFKDVSSTLNCLPEKAIERQRELGNIVFHAFDIVYYKGRCVEKLPLYKRKELLKEVIKAVNSPYIELVDYQSCGENIDTKPYTFTHGDIYDIDYISKEVYPTFYEEMQSKDGKDYTLSPKAFYEYIVATGGEGVIIKPKNGKYYHKRGREYLKVKKFITRELIICDYTEPTQEYTGKFPNNHWDYWLDEKGNKKPVRAVQGMKANKLCELGYTPVTRHYYEEQIGQLVLGVIITDEEYDKIPKNKRGMLAEFFDDDGNSTKVMQVCECSGFDDDTRAEITKNHKDYIGTVVEVGANEIFRDTGKLRHPRFLRFRPDKEFNRCIWKDHIN